MSANVRTEGGGTARPLTDAQESAAADLARGIAAADVAQRLSITTRTIRRWRADGRFIQRVRTVRGEMVRELSGATSAAAMRAVTKLEGLLASANECVVLGAAKALLAAASALHRDTDSSDERQEIFRRLEAIEAAAEVRRKGERNRSS
jgi:hypothetical protein